MKVIWFSWKDSNHPLAGGAETVSSNIREKLVRDGHEVTLFTAKYKDSLRSELVSGVHVRRYGNRFTVYILCLIQFILLPSSAYDLVVDEMNTLPFWAGAFTRKPKVLLCYQLAREVWHFQLRPPLSTIGYFLEPLYVRLLSSIYKTAITESDSTSKELSALGFKSVHNFRVGMSLVPLKSLGNTSSEQMFNLVFLGALRQMKRPLDAIKAFELAKNKLPNLKLTMMGNDRDDHADVVKRHVSMSKYADCIRVLGTVSQTQKKEVLLSAGAVIVTSIKEGWGLIVTEAGSLGVPAVAYDADGLRDSIVDGKTGLLAKNGSTSDLAIKTVDLLSHRKLRDKFSKNAWEFSKQFTFENSYKDFLNIIESSTTK